MPPLSKSWDGADGCQGSPIHSNLDWMANKSPKLASKAAYPYKDDPKSACQTGAMAAVPEVTVKEALYTYKGSEEILKKSVVEHGVALSGMWFDQASVTRAALLSCFYYLLY